MTDLPPHLVLLGSCTGFGLTAMMLVGWLGASVRRSAKGGYAAVPSERREALRAQAVSNSGMFKLALPLIQMLAPLFRTQSCESLRAYVGAPYAKAGHPGGLDEAELLAMSLLLGVGATALLVVAFAGLLGGGGAVLGLLGIPAGLMLTVGSLKTRGELREKRIMASLPYVLDLLVLVLRSGTSINQAIERVVQDYAGHPVGEEFGQVLAEIQLGSDRRGAFRRLAQRLELDDIQIVVDNILQSEELGWPLADTLERLSDRLNTRRSLRAQEYAGSAGVMVMLPSTLVLMSVVLLMFGPLIVRFVRGEMSFG